MKNKKLIQIILTNLIITLLILSSFTAYGTTNINENENKTNKFVRSVKASSFSASSEKVLASSLGYSAFDPSNNIVVSNTSANESYPAMAVNGYKALCSYDYNDGGVNKIYLRNSLNYGQSWSNPVKLVAKLGDISDIEIKSSDLSISPLNSKAYGAFISPLKNAGVMGYYTINNIGNLGEIKSETVDWTVYDFWGFTNPSIVAYNSSVTPWAITLIGSTNYVNPGTGLGPCVNSLMFCNISLDYPDYISIAWFPEIENCKNVVTANEYDSNIIYGVCEKQNGTNQDLLFFKGNPVMWYSGNQLFNKSITSPENLTNPHIFVKNNIIYIVAETETQGIILFRSINSGYDWIADPVTSSTINSKYPSVFVNSTDIFCTFIESGNISITSSKNGKDWDTALQLNDVDESVYHGYRQSDFPDENHVVWTDEREGKKDIYMILRDLPEIDLMIVNESVKIVKEGFFPFLETKNRILFTVKNAGEIYVEDIKVEITYTRIGKEPEKTNYQESIYYLDAGGYQSFNRTLFRLTAKDFISALLSFLRIQNITITVDPEGKYLDINPENNIYTLNVTYADIFPNLAFLEDILGKFFP